MYACLVNILLLMIIIVLDIYFFHLLSFITLQLLTENH